MANNGTTYPVFYIYGKYNTVVDTIALDYPMSEGVKIEDEESLIDHNLLIGERVITSKGARKIFTLDYKEFCTLANRDKIRKVQNYFRQGKKITFQPYANGLDTYEVYLTKGISEKLIYSGKYNDTTPIGFEGIEVVLTSKYLIYEESMYVLPDYPYILVPNYECVII